MNIVMIVPTGIGCEIGGHAGDAMPAAKLLAACCDKLILHPNVVNASDINEMPENALYVEGSILDRFLEGEVQLEEVRLNEILVAVNKPVDPLTVNTVSAARACLGADIVIVELETPLLMQGWIHEKTGNAQGWMSGWEQAISQLDSYKFDALALATEIEVNEKVAKNYFKNGGVNPWGGIEAYASRVIAERLDKPTAHAPFIPPGSLGHLSDFNEIVDPRIAAEMAAGDYLYCVLKGLHRAPRIGKGLSNKDVDFMVSPYGCWGRPHKACRKAGIPILTVKENKCLYVRKIGRRGCILVQNYWEAAGYIIASRIGMLPQAVRRPLTQTNVIRSE